MWSQFCSPRLTVVPSRPGHCVWNNCGGNSWLANRRYKSGLCFACVSMLRVCSKTGAHACARWLVVATMIIVHCLIHWIIIVVPVCLYSNSLPLGSAGVECEPSGGAIWALVREQGTDNGARTKKEHILSHLAGSSEECLQERQTDLSRQTNRERRHSSQYVLKATSITPMLAHIRSSLTVPIATPGNQMFSSPKTAFSTPTILPSALCALCVHVSPTRTHTQRQCQRQKQQAM